MCLIGAIGLLGGKAQQFAILDFEMHFVTLKPLYAKSVGRNGHQLKLALPGNRCNQRIVFTMVVAVAGMLSNSKSATYFCRSSAVREKEARPCSASIFGGISIFVNSKCFL